MQALLGPVRKGPDPAGVFRPTGQDERRRLGSMTWTTELGDPGQSSSRASATPVAVVLDVLLVQRSLKRLFQIIYFHSNVHFMKGPVDKLAKNSQNSQRWKVERRHAGVVLTGVAFYQAGANVSRRVRCRRSRQRPNMPVYSCLRHFKCVCLCALQDPSDLRCPLVPLCQTKRLVGRLIEMLPENHAQYSLALHLLEALEALTTED